MTVPDLISTLSNLPPQTLTLLSPIEDEAAYDAALEAEEVLSTQVRGNAEHPLGGVYRTLLAHITAYEAAAYPTPESPPHEMLAFLLEQRGWRQEDLAEALGVSQGTVSRLVRGKMKFTSNWINRLANVLGVSGAVFLDG